jgi:hypothetical protein
MNISRCRTNQCSDASTSPGGSVSRTLSTGFLAKLSSHLERSKAFSLSLSSNDASRAPIFSQQLFSHKLIKRSSKSSSMMLGMSLIPFQSCYIYEGVRYQLSEICQKFKVFPKTRGGHLPFCEFCHCPMLASLPVHMTSGNHCGNYFRQ